MRFMTLKEIRTEVVFGTTIIQPKKSNDHKGFLKSQHNPERIQVLHKEQPWSALEMKQKDLQSKRDLTYIRV